MQSPYYFPTPQSPSDITSRGLNMTDYLTYANDSISSVTVTEETSVLTITDSTYSGGLITFNVTGGVSGTDYLIKVDCVLASGDNESFFVYLTIT